MDNTSEEEIKNLKNQYEIEETVASILKFEGDILYFTEKLRRTKPRQFATEDRRLKSNKKRLSHWNQLATSFAIKCFGENNIKATTIMADCRNPQGSYSGENKKDNFDFIEKPKKFDGSRDPHVIDSWLLSIKDYFGALKRYDHEQLCKLGVTLLTGSAAPENTVSIARDKLRALKQTSTIAAYVQQFIMTTKLSIPKMTDDEAVDKFLAGLKDPDARIYVKTMT